METRFEIVTAVDRRYMEYLRLTLPTWRRHRQARQASLNVIYDADQVSEDEVSSVTQAWPKVPGCSVAIHAWAPQREFENQRARMLSAFIELAPIETEAPYWMKLDADVAFVDPEAPEWPLDEWLPTDAPMPHWIASPWGYTKPSEFVDRMDDWGDGVDFLRDCPRLNLHPEPGSGTLRHERMCSWLSFFGTEFTRELGRAVRDDPLPIISQDGVTWYASARLAREEGLGDCALGHRTKMKRHGWTHRRNLESLRKTVAQAWGPTEL